MAITLKLSAQQRARLRRRILRNVVICKATGCWIWQRRLNNWGYPMMNIRVPGRGVVSVLATRLSYSVFVRAIPLEKEAAHTCPAGERTSCVCPEHLRASSREDNEADKRRRPRPNRVDLRKPRYAFDLEGA